MANFSYCMNVHPADTLEDLIKNLKELAYPIAQKTKHIYEMGVELHLNHIVAEEAMQKIDYLKSNLEKLNLKVFSVNNYPLIDFHQKIVKDKVYLPSWAHTERTKATITCAKVLAQLIATNQSASISTLAGAYRYHDGFSQIDVICQNYLDAFEEIKKINQTYKVNISLALEPEPDTTLDSIQSIIQFFEIDLKKASDKRKLNFSQVKSIIGLNLDACHASVIFEKPADALRILHSKGIQTFKFHITNAPILRPPYTTEKIIAFKKLNEPKYLHQTFALKNKQVTKFKDLSDFNFENCNDYEEIRTHFHVPLNLQSFSSLNTSNEEVIDLLKAAISIPCGQNFVAETYTWPQHLESISAKNFNLINGIADEVNWLMQTYKNLSK